VTRLRVLDMCAAFDTVDFQILFKRIETPYDIGRNVPDWFKSFLSDQTQTVAFAGKHSRHTSAVWCFFQGSVLGLLLFFV
jgi:hypothetical protein